MHAICDKISDLTSVRTTGRSVEAQVGHLNRVLTGWGRYFRLGHVTRAWRTVQQHACRRLRQWLQRKTKQRGGPQNPPDLRLFEDYGLVQLVRSIPRDSLWAKAR